MAAIRQCANRLEATLVLGIWIKPAHLSQILNVNEFALWSTVETLHGEQVILAGPDALWQRLHFIAMHKPNFGYLDTDSLGERHHRQFVLWHSRVCRIRQLDDPITSFSTRGDRQAIALREHGKFEPDSRQGEGPE